MSFTVATLLSALIIGYSEGVCTDGIPVTIAVMFGPGRVQHRLCSSSRVLVNSQELDPGASEDVLVTYLRVTSGQGSEETVGWSTNQSKIDLGSTRGILGVYILGLRVHRPSCVGQ